MPGNVAPIDYVDIAQQKAELAARENQEKGRAVLASDYAVAKGVKVTVKTLPKTVGLGSLEVGASSGTTSELEVTYMKIEIDDTETVEIDKLNFICKINGTDLLADVRTQIGM